jgi:hypothetical protein
MLQENQDYEEEQLQENLLKFSLLDSTMNPIT